MLKNILNKKIYEYLSLTNYKKIILLISGGVDSIVLFNLLIKVKHKLNFELILFHYNYKKHSNANKAEILCKNLADNNKCLIISKNIKNINSNFEHNARLKRYSKTIDYAKKNNIAIILTAHHLDDQIETVYMNKIKKSDWVSKIGIRSELDMIKRPILSIRKINILNYAKKNQLIWINDSSNTDVSYLRNYIRINVLPSERRKNINFDSEIIEINKNSIQKFEAFQKNFKKYKTLFLLEECKYFIKILNKISNVDIVELKLFYQFIFQDHFDEKIYLTKSHWIEINNVIKLSKSGSMIDLNSKYLILKNRNDHYIILKSYYNKIKENITRNKVKIEEFPLMWNDTSFNETVKYKNKYIKINLPINLLKEGLYIRNWKNGDSCYSKYYKKNIKLKKLFINNKLSLIEKYSMPVFVNLKDEIIIIPDIYNKFTQKSDDKIIYWNKY